MGTLGKDNGGSGRGARRGLALRAVARGLVPAVTLGLFLGCGSSEPEMMTEPPEGMGFAKPVPPPPPSKSDALGSAADSGTPAPAPQ